MPQYSMDYYRAKPRISVSQAFQSTQRATKIVIQRLHDNFGNPEILMVNLLQESTDFAQQLDASDHSSLLSFQSKIQDLHMRFIHLSKESGNSPEVASVLFQQHFQQRIVPYFSESFKDWLVEHYGSSYFKHFKVFLEALKCRITQRKARVLDTIPDPRSDSITETKIPQPPERKKPMKSSILLPPDSICLPSGRCGKVRRCGETQKILSWKSFLNWYQNHRTSQPLSSVLQFSQENQEEKIQFPLHLSRINIILRTTTGRIPGTWRKWSKPRYGTWRRSWTLRCGLLSAVQIQQPQGLRMQTLPYTGGENRSSAKPGIVQTLSQRRSSFQRLLQTPESIQWLLLLWSNP